MNIMAKCPKCGINETDQKLRYRGYRLFARPEPRKLPSADGRAYSTIERNMAVSVYWCDVCNIPVVAPPEMAVTARVLRNVVAAKQSIKSKITVRRVAAPLRDEGVLARARALTLDDDDA